MRVGARNLLHLVKVFSDLDTDTTNAIGERCSWTRHAAGQTVLDESDPSTDIFFVVEGLAEARAFSSDGTMVAYTEIGRGEIFGEFSAIDEQPRSASITTREDSMVGRLGSQTFRDLLLRHPLAALRMCEVLVARNRASSARMFEFATLPVKERVTREVYRMAQAQERRAGRGPEGVEVAITHAEIAARVATHREAVTRTIGALAKEGVIRTGTKRYFVADMDRLGHLSGLRG